MLESTACKTSGNAFWSKLQRRTDNAFTSDVPDRYREFLRVLRCWRYLQIRKWFGLALFCAACPQPGINMPAGRIYDRASAYEKHLNTATEYLRQVFNVEADLLHAITHFLSKKSTCHQHRSVNNTQDKGKISIKIGLSLPDSIPTNGIEYAVGKFHLSAHIQQCYVTHTLNYIRGAASWMENSWRPFGDH
ncbi:hypothetical protein BC835DRAFT_1469334 [Cytidiella melzeri]|nr:hypothetical protein BC835DRAFT_1469334 [Cytidiella melzeri]